MADKLDYLDNLTANTMISMFETGPVLFRLPARSRNSAVTDRPYTGTKGPKSGPFAEQKSDNVHDPQNAHCLFWHVTHHLAPALRIRFFSEIGPIPNLSRICRTPPTLLNGSTSSIVGNSHPEPPRATQIAQRTRRFQHGQPRLRKPHPR